MSKAFYQLVSLKILVTGPLSVLEPIEETCSSVGKHPVGFKGQRKRALSDHLFKSCSGKDDIKGTSISMMLTLQRGSTAVVCIKVLCVAYISDYFRAASYNVHTPNDAEHYQTFK